MLRAARGWETPPITYWEIPIDAQICPCSLPRTSWGCGCPPAWGVHPKVVGAHRCWEAAAAVPEEFLPSWSDVLWRGVSSASLAGALLRASSSGALSACDSLPQTKFSHKIHHTLALARSMRRQQEVCGAGEEGRTIGNIIAQLIKLTGSCGQKAALPTFLLDAAVSLGSGGTSSPKTPSALVHPRAREPGRFSLWFQLAPFPHHWRRWDALRRAGTSPGGRNLSLVMSAMECQLKTCPPAAPRVCRRAARWLSSPAKGPAALGWVLSGEQHVLAGICSLPGDACGQKGRARARGGEIKTGTCLEVWVRVGTFMVFGRESQCYASSCCKGSYLAGGGGSTGS